jgi:hypothetical protein
MTMTATYEAVVTGIIESATVECLDYEQGLERLQWEIPNGARVVSLQVQY